MARIRKTQRRADQAPKARWQTALYIRLSREDGKNESYSVTNQKLRLMAYLDVNAQAESMELFDVYIDDGYTGTDSERDDFQRMLKDLDEGKINCIVVKDLSRLSRNDWECKRYLQHLFVVKDVRFVSLELPGLDSFKRPDEIYELGVTMQSTYNENHCRETSIKVRGTFDAKRRAGEFIGAFAPYGYAKDPDDKHRLIIDEPAAQVVRDIFCWFVCDGMSKNGIVKKLSAMAVPCPAAYKQMNGQNYHTPHAGHAPVWSHSTVTCMLKNQVYLGHMVQGKQKVKSYKVHTLVRLPEEEWFVVRDRHAPIIDQVMFDRAQNLMLRDTRTPPNSGQLHPLSGFLRCADCGKAMGRRSAKGIVYYACKSYTANGLCTRHSVRHDQLERIILAVIAQQVDLVENLDEVIDAVNAAPVQRRAFGRLESACKRKRAELAKTQVLYEGLYVDWKDGDISREAYHSMKRKFEEKQAQLTQEIAGLEKEMNTVAQSESLLPPNVEALCKRRTITELSRGIVVDLIDVIHVHEGGDVDVAFNFAAALP